MERERVRTVPCFLILRPHSCAPAADSSRRRRNLPSTRGKAQTHSARRLAREDTSDRRLLRAPPEDRSRAACTGCSTIPGAPRSSMSRLHVKVDTGNTKDSPSTHTGRTGGRFLVHGVPPDLRQVCVEYRSSPLQTDSTWPAGRQHHFANRTTLENEDNGEKFRHQIVQTMGFVPAINSRKTWKTQCPSGLARRRAPAAVVLAGAEPRLQSMHRSNCSSCLLRWVAGSSVHRSTGGLFSSSTCVLAAHVPPFPSSNIFRQRETSHHTRTLLSCAPSVPHSKLPPPMSLSA